MLRKIPVYFVVVLIFIWTMLVSAIAVPLLLINDNWAPAIQRLWSQGWCFLLGVKIKVYNVENLRKADTFVLAPNHASTLDIMVVSCLPIHFKWILKRELLYIPVFGWAVWAMGSYIVRRDKSGRDLNVMRQVEEGLRNKKTVLVFPEGTRTRTGELLPFKKGAFRLAQNAGVPLCPIALIGTRAITPPGGVPTHLGHHVSVRIGEPYLVPREANIADVMKDYRRQLLKLLEAGM